jgi:hypothetical protein
MIDVNRHVSIQMDADGNVLRIGSQKTSDEKPIEASTNVPAITVEEAADFVDVVPNHGGYELRVRLRQLSDGGTEVRVASNVHTDHESS